MIRNIVMNTYLIDIMKKKRRIGNHRFKQDSMSFISNLDSHNDDRKHSKAKKSSLIISVNSKIFKRSIFKNTSKILRINDGIIIILRKRLDFVFCFYYYHSVQWNRILIKLWSGRLISFFLSIDS